jgi:hypothetical protein
VVAGILVKMKAQFFIEITLQGAATDETVEPGHEDSR